MKFAEQVKHVRMKLELSQGALAKELDVSTATVCRWEAGNRKPQLATLGKFYNYCEKRGLHLEPVE